jgi:hypothetical protein
LLAYVPRIVHSEDGIRYLVWLVEGISEQHHV